MCDDTGYYAIKINKLPLFETTEVDFDYGGYKQADHLFQVFDLKLPVYSSDRCNYHNAQHRSDTKCQTDKISTDTNHVMIISTFC